MAKAFKIEAHDIKDEPKIEINTGTQTEEKELVSDILDDDIDNDNKLK